MTEHGDVDVHPIEVESYRILRSRIDLSRLPPLSRAVTERVIHASADFDYATDLVTDEDALAAAVEALRQGAPVVADAMMVASGITGYPVICRIGDSLTERLARTANLTRAAAAVRLAFGDAGPGAIWVVGVAPTAIEEILTRGTQPAFVIGLPVGFVGAAEAKEALRASGAPSLTNVSEKGGSAVAAAAFNALVRIARAAPAVPEQGSPAPTEQGSPAPTEPGSPVLSDQRAPAFSERGSPAPSDRETATPDAQPAASAAEARDAGPDPEEGSP